MQQSIDKLSLIFSAPGLSMRDTSFTVKGCTCEAVIGQEADIISVLRAYPYSLLNIRMLVLQNLARKNSIERFHLESTVGMSSLASGGPQKTITFPSLQDIVVRGGCPADVTFLGNFLAPSLLRLCVSDNNSARINFESTSLRLLRQLHIANCAALDSIIIDATFMPRLEKLDISNLSRLRTFKNSLSGLSCLVTLVIRMCPLVDCMNMHVGGNLALETVDISNCSLLSYLPVNVSQTPSLKTLSLQNLGDSFSLHSAICSTKFSELVLIGLCGIQRIDESHIPLSIERLTVIRCPNLNSIVPLKARNWKKICIHAVPMLGHFPAVFSLASGGSCAALALPSVLENAKGRSKPWYMANLSLCQCNSLLYISERINCCAFLQSVVISQCKALKTIGRSFWNNAYFSRVHLLDLPSLTLVSADGLFDSNLRSLVVKDCVSLVLDLNKLAGLSLLETLVIRDTKEFLFGGRSIPGNAHLKRLSLVFGSGNVCLGAGVEKLTSLTDLDVHCSDLVVERPEILTRLQSLCKISIRAMYYSNAPVLRTFSALESLSLQGRGAPSSVSIIDQVVDDLPFLTSCLQRLSLQTPWGIDDNDLSLSSSDVRKLAYCLRSWPPTYPLFSLHLSALETAHTYQFWKLRKELGICECDVTCRYTDQEMLFYFQRQRNLVFAWLACTHPRLGVKAHVKSLGVDIIKTIALVVLGR